MVLSPVAANLTTLGADIIDNNDVHFMLTHKQLIQFEW